MPRQIRPMTPTTAPQAIPAIAAVLKPVLASVEGVTGVAVHVSAFKLLVNTNFTDPAEIVSSMHAPSVMGVLMTVQLSHASELQSHHRLKVLPVAG